MVAMILSATVSTTLRMFLNIDFEVDPAQHETIDHLSLSSDLRKTKNMRQSSGQKSIEAKRPMQSVLNLSLYCGWVFCFPVSMCVTSECERPPTCPSTFAPVNTVSSSSKWLFA